VQKWEHLSIQIRFNHQNGCIRETIIYGKSKSYPEDAQPSIQSYLADLKEDGWDLVGIVGVDLYLFSRMVREAG
jgi:hypothetical protein